MARVLKLSMTEDLDVHTFTVGKVNNNSEYLAKQLFEISSEQRLNILFRLQKQKSTMSKIAKELQATMPEVFRNFERLTKAGLIEKDPDSNYHLTLYGRTVCANLSSLFFVKNFEKYFKNHDYGDIPEKFIQRIGVLSSAQHIKGVVKMLEVWKKIHNEAKDYIHNILAEVPYSNEIIEVVVSQAKKNTKIRSIFSESVIIPEARKELFDKLGFKKFIQNGIIERKMRKDVKVVVLLNEKEACILFPTKDGDADMSEMLYSTDSHFHEWCSDYFKYCWENTTAFQEGKLK